MLQLRRELQGTSSQDEFARWAKVRRTLDKKIVELERLSIAHSLSNFLTLLTGDRCNDCDVPFLLRLPRLHHSLGPHDGSEDVPAAVVLEAPDVLDSRELGSGRG